METASGSVSSTVGEQTSLDKAMESSGFTSWDDEYKKLEALATDGSRETMLDALEELIKTHPSATEAYLLAGRIATNYGAFDAAVTLFGQASKYGLAKSLTPQHPYSPFLIKAQLRQDPMKLPCRGIGAQNMSSNLSALKQIEPGMAREIALAKNPPNPILIDIWGELMMINPESGALAVSSNNFINSVQDLLETRNSIAMFGVGSGQEILQVLENSPIGFMGCTSCHYLFEKDAQKLRVFLQMSDLSQAITERRLIIFGGCEHMQAMERVFSNGSFPIPAGVGGDMSPYKTEYERIIQKSKASPEEELRVSDFYGSEAFKKRLEAISRGEILPRVLFLTCRWTTVLQHICSTFRDGFKNLGCETEYLIERSDVETLTRSAYTRAFDNFKPDLVFSVSHARPSYSFLPATLPVMGFIMDNCGPILKSVRLDDKIEPLDLFVCINRKFKEFLQAKKVPACQTEVMITPSDPSIYRPLDPDHPDLERFRIDISWMKHAGSGDEAQNLGTLVEVKFNNPGDPYEKMARRILLEIHRQITSERTRQWFDDDIWRAAEMLLEPNTPDAWLDELRALLIEYKIMVYASSYRQHMLKPLLSTNMGLRLYGNGWHKHKLFAPHAGESLSPGEELNAAYNGSSINIHIHMEMSMHQRLVEGALAGGFFLVNRLDPTRDYEPLDSYFEEGKEFIYFDSGEDLVEKCRYYLAHEDERRVIAKRMRKRALENYTLDRISNKMLEFLKSRIRAVGQGNPASFTTSK